MERIIHYDKNLAHHHQLHSNKSHIVLIIMCDPLIDVNDLDLNCRSEPLIDPDNMFL